MSTQVWRCQGEGWCAQQDWCRRCRADSDSDEALEGCARVLCVPENHSSVLRSAGEAVPVGPLSQAPAVSPGYEYSSTVTVTRVLGRSRLRIFGSIWNPLMQTKALVPSCSGSLNYRECVLDDSEHVRAHARAAGEPEGSGRLRLSSGRGDRESSLRLELARLGR